MKGSKMSRANEVLLYRYRTTGMTLHQMIRTVRENVVEARTLARRRELAADCMRIEMQLENFLGVLQKKHPSIRENLPSRVEHDMIRLLLDRLERFLADEETYLRGNFQTTRAERAQALVLSIQEAKAVLLTDERPTSPLNGRSHG